MARVTYPRCAVVLEPIVAPLGSDVAATQRKLTIPPVVPMSADVTRNPAEQADTATVEIEFDVLPFDPRFLRDVRISIYADALTDPGTRLEILPSTARFVGFADWPEMSFTDRGNVVRLSARDYRGRLVDTPCAVGAVDLTPDLVDVVYNLTSAIPGYARGELTVSVQSNTSPRAVYGKSRWTVPRGATVWDAIVSIAHLTGQSAWFNLDRLVIGDPRTAEDSTTYSIAFGESVEAESFRRNMNPMAKKAVQVIATNPRTRQTTSGRWPAVARDGETVQAIAVTGAFTAAACQASARRVYESAERAQIEGVIQTRDPIDREGRGLLNMIAGDKVYAYFRTTDDAHVLAKSAAEIAAFMVASGMSASVAADLSTRYVQAKDYRPLFYVRRNAWKWTRDGGLNFTLDVENLVDLGLV